MVHHLREHIHRDAFLHQVDDIHRLSVSGSIVQNQFVILVVEDAGSISHTFDGIHSYLNLAQLNTVAFVLHLEVLAGYKHQIAILSRLHQIACTIDNIVKERIQRILHKHLVGLLAVAIVAEGHTGSPDAKFAHLFYTGFCIVIFQYQHLHILAGLANGDILIVGILTFDIEVSAVNGNLRRAI